MRRNQFDILINIKSRLPRFDRVEMIANSSKRRSKISIRRVRSEFWTRLLELLLNCSSPV
jgi:hypothetical protein